MSEDQEAIHRWKRYSAERTRFAATGMLALTIAEVLTLLGVDKLDGPLWACLGMCSLAMPLLVALVIMTNIYVLPSSPEEESGPYRRIPNRLLLPPILLAIGSLGALLLHFNGWVAGTYLLSVIIGFFTAGNYFSQRWPWEPRKSEA